MGIRAFELKKVLVGLAGSLLLAGCASQAPVTYQQKVTTGKLLYRNNCAACHGNGGVGSMAPPIIGASVRQIKNAINTIPMMQKFLGDVISPAEQGRMSSKQVMHYLKVGINNRMYETPDRPAFSDQDIKYISLYLKHTAAIPSTPKRTGN